MAGKNEELLWKLAESDEVDIETRRDRKSPVHRTTIWIVPVQAGVYVRSFKGKKGRWYQEALANPQVTIRVGRRKVAARAEPGKNPSGVRADDRFCQTVRHWVGIGKEGGLGELRIPRPEADANLLSIAANPPDDAGIRWRLDRTAGVARDGQVEGAPPEGHRRGPLAETA